jgi:hypothetical protein
MKNLNEMIVDIDKELAEVKNFVNENGYNNGTAIAQIVRKYRKELKEYRQILINDLDDGVVNYTGEMI